MSNHQHDHHHHHSHHGHSHGEGRVLAARHDHVFLGGNHERNERRTWIVIAITATMMVIEIAALAYLYARKHSNNRRFTFGTGKLGDLAGFSSAIVLALIALLIGWESLRRLNAPVAIDFSEAILVAVAGLIVNLVCAWLLKDDHAHHHHDHHGSHHGHHGGQDRNLRAAYLHVLADALTSVLAIVALGLGAIYGWLWLDPAIGIVGAIVIARWSFGLIRDTGATLLDYLPEGEDLPEEIGEIVAKEDAEIVDLHVWQLGPGHHGAIVSIVADNPRAPSYYREKLAAIHDLSHVTVEVEARAA
ncbi:CDF family Co(II)/Ni(II) efflux transporter DmeF [Sinorhizobium sp. NFACC03]|uniref:CDF family Co(II)/Ni(II) efflux transporter DmeF n=1 Tax=Sinorhizobium sp. NFACC03 TaxID=1566295 RepID=UPI0008816E8B|nr:CDF family Co(II)/Ni(II) efflux transporter DmeF [Sinorhizobium sp. NFACC03]SDA91529.1 cation diffusion facilitator family transporter [Sinorhizobium sp. NFACC03]